MKLQNFEQFEASLHEGLYDWLLGKKSSVEEPKSDRELGLTTWLDSPISEVPPVGDKTLLEFYSVLQEFSNSNQSIPVRVGEIQYSKVVEYIQIALSFLGYPLPSHGIDGKFGPETANAIIKFNSDNSVKKNDDQSEEGYD